MQSVGTYDITSHAEIIPQFQHGCTDLTSLTKGETVSQSKHNIFISYAHVDDKAFGDQPKGWVTNLVDALKTKLAEYLGREEYFDLWQDRNKLHGNDLIQDTIMETLDQTDILLIILSPGYLNSKWCQLELDRFVEKMQSHKDITRVFVVEKNKADPPDCLKGLLNYRFWEQKDSKKAPTVFGAFKPDETFYQVVNDIAYEMSQKLELIKQQTPVQPQVVDHRPQIYLARPAEDSFKPYEEVKRFLDSEGYRVVPETHIGYMNPTQYQEDVNKIMASCKAYVQVVGCSPGKLSPELPGICVLQHDCACKKDIPRLIWRGKIDVEQIGDQKHKEFVSLESEFINIEQFKQSILQKLKPKRPKKRLPPSFVFVNARLVDLKISDKIIKILENHRIAALKLRTTGKRSDIQEDFKDNLKTCNGLIVVYGKSDFKWAKNMLIKCYKVCITREKFHAFALYQGPPTQKPDLRAAVNLPNIHYIDCSQTIDEKQFDPFLDDLRQGGVS
jgi:hypothetical protein